MKYSGKTFSYSPLICIKLGFALFVISGRNLLIPGKQRLWVSSMVYILDGNSEHGAHAKEKKLLWGENTLSLYNQMSLTDQITEIAPYVRTYFWGTGWPGSYRKYILQITQPSQYRYAKLRYRFAVTCGSPSMSLVCPFVLILPLCNVIRGNIRRS